LDRFLEEARTVFKFNHPNIIRIFRFFEQNGTGYIVMEYIEGRELSSILDQEGTLDESRIRAWLWPIMEGLQTVHEAGFLHRDIKPPNIMIRKDGAPILLDFGAARLAMGGRTRSLTAIMTPGFAPIEQYASRGNQGPWTDIYALGAVMYRCITGSKPLDAMDRVLDDRLEPIDASIEKTYSRGLIKGMKAALAFREGERPQDLDEWLEMLDDEGDAPTRRVPDKPVARPITPKPEAQPEKSKNTTAPPAVEDKSSARKWLLVAIPLVLVVTAIGYWFTVGNKGSPPVLQNPKLQVMESQPQPEPAVVAQEEKPAVQTAQNASVEVPYGGINVRSDPPGASIYVDGEYAGMTPANLRRFEKGRKAVINLQLNGYESAEQVVIAPDKGSRDVFLTLQKSIPEYALTIETEPANATVKILNIEPRYRQGMLLEPGRYHIEVSKSGYETKTDWLKISNSSLIRHIELNEAIEKNTKPAETSVINSQSIAVVPFAWEAAQPKPKMELTEVISADLYRSGLFALLDEKNMIERPADVDSIRFSTWRKQNVDYILIGAVRSTSNGKGYEFIYQLFDVQTQERLLSNITTVGADDLRFGAHRVADAIYEMLTGTPGAFATRIAYVQATGSDDDQRYELVVADADGFNPQSIIGSPKPLLSPAWSPDGKSLAYVSFEKGGSAVYIQDVASGRRQLIPNKNEELADPAFSPNGKSMAMAHRLNNNWEIILRDLNSGDVQQLTHHPANDSEPVFSADGGSILFTSDRGGVSQIYRMPLNGGPEVQMTFEGDSNSGASLSSYGQDFVLTHSDSSGRRIAVSDYQTKKLRFLTSGSMDRSPGFAPNGSMIIFSSRKGSRDSLSIVSSNGNVRQKMILSSGNIREQAWGPLTH
jgi:TolB protein